MTDNVRMTTTTRAAKITYLLYLHGRLTNEQIKEAGGYGSMEGVRMLMTKMSLSIPIYQPEIGVWALLEEPGRRPSPRQ